MPNKYDSLNQVHHPHNQNNHYKGKHPRNDNN